MLKIENSYDDRDAIVTSRAVATGQDGPSVTAEPGETVEIEFDGDNQVVISTRGRAPGEAALEGQPVAHAVAPEGGLKDADDATVQAEIKDMVDNKADLTGSGAPNLVALNERLQAKGFNPVNAARRDELMPQPA